MAGGRRRHTSHRSSGESSHNSKWRQRPTIHVEIQGINEITESRRFLRRMRDFGYDKLPHGFFNPGRGGTWHLDTLQEMDAFLTRLAIWRHARRRYGVITSAERAPARAG